MIEFVFPEHGPLNSVTLFEKHILSFSRPDCCEDLAWLDLKELAELANSQYKKKILSQKRREFSVIARF